MNAILDPLGGRSPAVYWRRRALLFGVLAVAVLLLARTCGSDGPSIGTTVVQKSVPLAPTFTPTPTPTTPPAPLATAPPADEPAKRPATPSGAATPRPTPKATATATPRPSPATDAEAAGPLNCARSALTVTLRSDQRTYSPGERPKLFLGVKNTGKDPCLVDLGSKALSFTVMSGEDRIWSSDDCQGKGTSDVRLLKPGQALEARSIWSKVRSVPGCPKGQPEARPGTYLLEGSAGKIEAKKRAVFQLA